MAQRVSASFLQRGGAHKRICVYDCRVDNGKATQKFLESSGLDFNDFLKHLHKEFRIRSHETFVVATTDRTVLDFDKFEEIQDGSTLYLLQHKNQALSVATEEQINYLPHYDTLIRSGMYEYYASEGQNSLPYALAELIDNALSATAKNSGVRTIEIRMMFDETLGKPAVIVLDNGCGMTSKQLNNWAVYRLSKFSRENSKFASQQEGYVRPDPVPRSLNSDISYFGVGGKQAVFYIGDSARMISKPVNSPDVHELILSKDEFEKKEKNNEDIYSGRIKNRKPGDSTHVKNDDEHFLHALIAEESRKESFTAVVITGVQPEHVTFLKEDFEVWVRQLAHIYHYYIHGVNGNDTRKNSANSDHQTKIDIQITLREKRPGGPRVMDLRDVDDDMQSLYINSAADTFEFKAFTAQDGGTVEGVIRYHPFLYDRETYPKDPCAEQASPDGDDDDDCANESGVQHQARGKRAIFDCFWNGRLIPYTTVSEFEWCTDKKSKLPAECYNRISGVLFTDDKFQVSTNKLTFMDLELKLKNKDTIFTRIVNGQCPQEKNSSADSPRPAQARESVTGKKDQSKKAGLPLHPPLIKKQRGNLQKEFTKWLENCHKNLDKQIQFKGYIETITRLELPKKMQEFWATFSSIVWDKKTYKTGDLVKSHKTGINLYGVVVRFLLYGNHKEDVFATAGFVELALEPKALYDKVRIIPISKIDQTATKEAIEKNINKDLAKLPEKLRVDWPDRNPWPQNGVRPAGTVLGPFKIEILNKNKESLSRMPSVGHGPVKKLFVVLKLIHHDPKGDQEIASYTASYRQKWAYWFKSFENLTALGKYSLCLNTAINESNVTDFGGSELPSYELNFTIKEGSAESFVINVASPALTVGVPFDIPLQIKDAYGHPTSPPPNLKPVLECSGLEVSYEKVDSSGPSTFTIRSVKARGRVPKESKPFDLTVTLPGMKTETQILKIFLYPGMPHSLHVMPEDNPIITENGSRVEFTVEIHDEAGNITTQPRQAVRCQVHGFAPEVTDCSSTGTGQIVTRPINLKITKGEPQKLRVHFEISNRKNIASVVRELKVIPSTRVTTMELYSQDDENLVLRNKEKIEWMAGGLLENLFYRLFDEAGREVPLTAEIGSKIKVNWTGDANLADLVQGKLPDVQVPRQVQKEHFYQVSYHNQSVAVSFTIVPHPDEPARLKVTLPQSTLRLGEILPGNINLELVDQYDNVTKSLTSSCVKQMSVKADGLDASAIAFTWQEKCGSVLVTGIRFQSGTLGPREICFTYKSYVERVIIKITAGVPAQLQLISEPEKPLQVLNDRGIPTPFLIQLCDEWGNPSSDRRVVVELRSSPPTLKLTTAVTSQPVNAEGKASFTVTSVSGPKGYYQLQFRGSFNKKPILGPSVNITVLPDPTKPVSLSVKYDTNGKFPAGGKFPVFSVTVVSDEGSPMTTFNPAAVAMYLWKGGATQNTPPQGTTGLRCSKPMENERNDCFYFRDKEIPEQTGKYTIQFSLHTAKDKLLFSNQISVNVVANQPVKLGPDSQPPTPVVSYSKAISSRTLVENMTLRIMDLYGNPAGEDLNGTVEVSIKNCVGYNNKKLPLFVGKVNSVQISLAKGEASITRLAIMENSPGENGSSYILFFKPEVTTVSTPLDAFELCFEFYNDVEKQQKMVELTRKRDELITAIGRYKDIFFRYDELHQMLEIQYQEAAKKETHHRIELQNRNVNIKQPVTVPAIDRLLEEKKADAERIEKAPRRVCTIRDHFKGQQDVLGMVGHLAYVQDDAAARVISWHIRGDMDCVITKTSEAAQRIYHDTQGRQQVMALDSVFVTPGDRLLPHIRNGRNLFEPLGNPVYARKLLIYPHDPESCDMVFKNILGDTILMDDLESANNYRRAVVQNKTQCPTILTRQGDRISSRGKFGGTQNKAPDISMLQVFGAPYPKHYYTLKGQIERLTQYHSVVLKRDKAAEECEEHMKTMNSPEMQQKKKEMEEFTQQLEDIERQRASRPARPVKRRSEDATQPSGITAKRLK